MSSLVCMLALLALKCCITDDFSMTQYLCTLPFFIRNLLALPFFTNIFSRRPTCDPYDPTNPVFWVEASALVLGLLYYWYHSIFNKRKQGVFHAYMNNPQQPMQPWLIFLPSCSLSSLLHSLCVYRKNWISTMLGSCRMCPRQWTQFVLCTIRLGLLWNMPP